MKRIIGKKLLFGISVLYYADGGSDCLGICGDTHLHYG